MSDILERLEENLDASYDTSNDREAWTVQSQDDAAWASRKAARAHAAIAQVNAWEEREIERIKVAAESERARHQQDAEFFEGHLAQYLIRLQQEGRKTKSLNLPGGKIALRARQPKLDVLDEEKAVEQLRGTDYVRVKESINKTKLRKVLTKADGALILTTTGEVIDWAALEEQPDSVTFTPATDSE